jgi:hypothetical protein
VANFSFSVEQVPDFPKNLSEADIYSYKKLVQVSRSFAAVIAELPEDLRRPVRALPGPRPFFPRFYIVSTPSSH